jgi:hypothetical protein
MAGSRRRETVHIPQRSLRRAIAAATATLLLALAGVVTAASPAAADEVRAITFPVYGKVSYTDDFGAPRAQGSHQGNDIMGAKLMPELAAHDATVKYLRVDSRGNLVILRDAEGWEYWYIHINNDTPGTDDGANPAEYGLRPGIKVGTKVLAGEWIAYMGDSGDAESTAPHLHFEIHRPDGTPINPYNSLQAAFHGGMDPKLWAANSPVGTVDVVTGSGGVMVVRGWAFDPNVKGPSTVLFYIDGNLAGTLQAGESRPDVGAAYPAAGPNHGYTAYLTPSAGTHRMCAYAINDGPGGSPGIGCATVDVGTAAPPPPPPPKGRVPIGNVDALNAGAGRGRIMGWALDFDTTAPIDVHVYVDGRLTAVTTASVTRTDVGAAFPGMGDQHGFAISFGLASGPHTVCAYAIDDAHTLANPLLGCRQT